MARSDESTPLGPITPALRARLIVTAHHSSSCLLSSSANEALASPDWMRILQEGFDKADLLAA
jgi:hypothetical protein